MTQRILLLLSLALLGCSTPPRTVVVLPLSKAPATQEAMELATGRVQFNGTMLSDAAIRKQIPTQVRSLNQLGKTRAIEMLERGVTQFYNDDASKGLETLKQGWNLLKHHPEWLPRKTEKRKTVFGALLTLYRVWSRTEPDAAQPLLPWVARHLWDQRASVKQLPPKLEYRFAETAETIQAGRYELRIHTDELDHSCDILLNGLHVGQTPMQARMLPGGTHRVWIECTDNRSWVVQLDAQNKLSLKTHRIPLQDRVFVNAQGLSVPPSAHPKTLEEIGRTILPWLDVDGVIWVPVDTQNKPAVLTTRGNIQPIQPVRGRYFVDNALVKDQKDDWYTIAWVAFGSAALLAGGGLAMNLQHEALMDATNTGRADHRKEANGFKLAATTLYVTAGVVALSSVTFWILGVSQPGDPNPLFENALTPQK